MRVHEHLVAGGGTRLAGETINRSLARRPVALPLVMLGVGPLLVVLGSVAAGLDGGARVLALVLLPTGGLVFLFALAALFGVASSRLVPPARPREQPGEEGTKGPDRPCDQGGRGP